MAPLRRPPWARRCGWPGAEPPNDPVDPPLRPFGPRAAAHRRLCPTTCSRPATRWDSPTCVHMLCRRSRTRRRRSGRTSALPPRSGSCRLRPRRARARAGVPHRALLQAQPEAVAGRARRRDLRPSRMPATGRRSTSLLPSSRRRSCGRVEPSRDRARRGAEGTVLQEGARHLPSQGEAGHERRRRRADRGVVEPSRWPPSSRVEIEWSSSP